MDLKSINVLFMFFTRLSLKYNVSIDQIQLYHLFHSSSYLLNESCYSDTEMILCLCIFRLFNQYFQLSLPLIDFSRKNEFSVHQYKQYYINENAIEKWISKVMDPNHTIKTSETRSSFWSSSFIDILSQYRYLLPFYTKKQFWNMLVDTTCSITEAPQDEYDKPLSIPDIKINRVKAIEIGSTSELPSSQKKHSLNEIRSESVSSQVYEKMKQFPCSHFRREYTHNEDAGQKRAFFVHLIGEGSYDNGGPYRSILSMIACDEPKGYMKLIVPSNNDLGEMSSIDSLVSEFKEPEQNSAEKQQNINQVLSRIQYDLTKEYYLLPHNYEVYRSSSLSELKYYLIWGLYLALSQRHNVQLSLSLSSFFWKPFVKEVIGIEDIYQVDNAFIRSVTSLLLNSSTSKEQLELLFSQLFTEDFVAENEESFDTQNVYQLLKQSFIYYLQSSLYSSYLVYSGLKLTLPMDLSCLFTPKEFEEIFCGESVVTTEELQRIATYEHGLKPTHPAVVVFWRAVEMMSDDERAMLLNFVTARSRIPIPPAPSILFKIALLDEYNVGTNDDHLPQSQTCFSLLKLPSYSTAEVAYQKFLLAINNTPNMDLDVHIHNAEGWEDL